jgi:hypothetical protein
VFLQADPNLTFRDDLKQELMEVMADGNPICISPKCVKEPSNDSSKIMFTSCLAVQVSIPDTKKAAEYTETLAKLMEYFNSNGSHPIISSRVFIPFGKTAVIDNGTFRKFICMQHEYLHNICHIEIHHLCNFYKDISIGYDTTGEILNSSIRQLLMYEVDDEGKPINLSISRMNDE